MGQQSLSRMATGNFKIFVAIWMQELHHRWCSCVTLRNQCQDSRFYSPTIFKEIIYRFISELHVSQFQHVEWTADGLILIAGNNIFSIDDVGELVSNNAKAGFARRPECFFLSFLIFGHTALCSSVQF